MITKELIYNEIEQLNDEYLDEAYTLIRNLAQANRHEKKPGLLSKLRQIHIAGPEDFAKNLDLYLSGEKHA
jgi:hypothetical protein